MMEGIVLAVLALLSVPVLLIVILVKVCGLENKVADLTRKFFDLRVSASLRDNSSVSADLTQSHRDTENNISRRGEMHPSRERSGCLSEANPEGAARGCEAQRGLELGAKPPAPQTNLRVSASPRDASPAPSTVSPERSEPRQRSLEGCEAKPSASTSAEGAKAPSTSEAKPSASTSEAKAPAAPAAPLSPYEPTAFDIFWMRIEDWLAVRGDFAPKGMTHEFAFATRWLVRVGVVLILGAIIYFVELSIDRGWMGPTGRVAATLFWGAVACVGGTWLVRKGKYALIGHAVAALGVVALYLGFGLGHRFFDPPVIASWTFAFAALAAVTAFSGVMAVYLRSPFIAVMGLVGGYLVPVIAGRDSGFPLGLDVYLVVLNLGAFYVSRKRLWSALDFLASMLAVLMCFVWGARHADFGGHSAVLVNLAFLSVVHALYMTGVIVGAKTRGKVGNAIAWAGLCVNAVAYFAWLSAVFRESFSSSYAGLILLGLVAAYLAVATLAIRRGWADRETVNILLVFALVFLAIVPLLLFDHPWCIVSWAALAVAAAEAEARSGQRVLGALSYLLLIVAGLGGLFYYAPLAYCERSVSALKALTAGEYFKEFVLRLLRLWSLPVAAVLVARRVKVDALAVAALICAFLFFTGEARIFGYVFFPSLETGAVSVAWLVAAFAGLWVGIVRRSRVTRITALSLLGVTVVKVLLMDTARLATPARVGVFALTGVLLIVGAFLYMKFKERFEE